MRGAATPAARMTSKPSVSRIIDGSWTMLLSVSDFRPNGRFALANLTFSAALRSKGRNDAWPLSRTSAGFGPKTTPATVSRNVASTYVDGSASRDCSASSETVRSICATFAGS